MKTLRLPGDKSISHRALMLSTFVEGQSRLRGLLTGEDAHSTATIMRQLGGVLPDLNDREIVVDGVGRGALSTPGAPLDCGNSGTTARLMIGAVAGLPIDAIFTGDESLRSRPMRRITEPLAVLGARFDELGEPGRLPIRVHGGTLRPGQFTSPHASAQIKSALLLAGLCAGVEMQVTEPTRTRDHTERMLRSMGVSIDEELLADGSNRVRLHPAETLAPLDLDVPADISSAAFFLAAAILGVISPVRLLNVGTNEARTGILDALQAMQVQVGREAERETGGEPVADLIVEAQPCFGTTVQGALVPRMIDEVPVLAVLGARAQGETVVRDASELRVKESDRIRVVVENLRSIGVQAEELPDGLVVQGTDAPLKGNVRAANDHRIAMAFGLLAAQSGNEIRIDHPEVAAVSFPAFWDMLGVQP